MSAFSEKYKIQRQVGQGTQGVVYLGEEIIPEGTGPPVAPRQVAIKRCVCSSDEMVKEMISEYNLVSTLDHPNIIKYFDYFKNTLKDEYTEEESTEIILVMEPCDSGLTNVIKQKTDERSVFDAIILENWIKQICGGIKYLHEQGVIHRDLKPDNILIMTHGSSNELEWSMKIVDFGCASSKERPGGKIVGTPLYMAPEVLSENYDEKVDIYSFGVLLYEMLTLKSIEDLSRDMDNIKLYHTMIGKLLQGYDKFFVEICRMVINRNKEKRSRMRDVFAFIRNMGSSSIKPGPVISKSDLEILKQVDVDDLLEEYEGDTKKQKEFLRDMEKKSSQLPPTKPSIVTENVSKTTDDVPKQRGTTDPVEKKEKRKSIFFSPRKQTSGPTTPTESKTTIPPLTDEKGRRRSLVEMLGGFFKK